MMVRDRRRGIHQNGRQRRFAIRPGGKIDKPNAAAIEFPAHQIGSRPAAHRAQQGGATAQQRMHDRGVTRRPARRHARSAGKDLRVFPRQCIEDIDRIERRAAGK